MADLIGKVSAMGYSEVQANMPVASGSLMKTVEKLEDGLAYPAGAAALVALVAAPPLAAYGFAKLVGTGVAKGLAAMYAAGSVVFVAKRGYTEGPSLEAVLNGATPLDKMIHTGEHLITDPKTGRRTLIRDPNVMVMQQQHKAGEEVTAASQKVDAIYTRLDAEMVRSEL